MERMIKDSKETNSFNLLEPSNEFNYSSCHSKNSSIKDNNNPGKTYENKSLQTLSNLTLQERNIESNENNILINVPEERKENNKSSNKDIGITLTEEHKESKKKSNNSSKIKIKSSLKSKDGENSACQNLSNKEINFNKSSELDVKDSYNTSNLTTETDFSVEDLNQILIDVDNNCNFEVCPFYLMKITKGYIYLLDSQSKKLSRDRHKFLYLPKDFSQVIYKYTLILTGGVNKSPIDKMFKVVRTDANLYNIIEMKPFKYPRFNHCSCIADNYLYIISGNNNKTVEKYDLISEIWTELPELNEVHENSRCLILGSLLYVFLGKQDVNYYSYTIERYNLSGGGEWEIIKLNMNIKLQSFSLIGYGDEIIICGGKEDYMMTKKECYSYNVRTNVLVKYKNDLPYDTTFKNAKFMQFYNYLINTSDKGLIIFNPNDGSFITNKKGKKGKEN